jgi:hypothetical protein
MAKNYATYVPQNIEQTDQGYKIVYSKSGNGGLGAVVNMKPAPAAPPKPPEVLCISLN